MADTTYGWVGKIAKIDLTTRKVDIVPTSNYVPKFLGGRALAAKLYWDDVSPSCAAFDPENRIIFATGPAGATFAAGSSRTAIVTKSPEPIPECYMYSVTGGSWAAELKFSGFDAVVVGGKSTEPVYIYIHDGQVEIKKAERLWGLMTSAADAEIRKLWGDKTRSMLIGPAGENLIKTAVIVNDISHGTGLGGFGSVMGSKNLKAIAVRGTGGVQVKRPKDLINAYADYAMVGGKYGGPYLVTSDAYLTFHQTDVVQAAGAPKEIVPVITQAVDDVYNYEEAQWAKCLLSIDEIKAGTLKRKFDGCFACPACCGFAAQFMDPTGLEGAPKNLNTPMTIGQQCGDVNRQTPWEAKVFGGKIMGRAALMFNATNAELGINILPLGSQYNWFEEAVALKLLTKENTGLPCGDYAAYNTPAMIGKDGYQYGITYRKNDFFKRLAEGQERFLYNMAKENPAWKPLYEKYISLPRYHLAQWGAGGKTSVNMIYEATQYRTKPNEASTCFSGIGTPFLGKTLCGFVSQAEMLKAQEANRSKWARLVGPKSYDLTNETQTWQDKVRSAIFWQHMQMENDSMTTCGWMHSPRFFSPNTPDHLGEPDYGAKILAAVTGIDRTFEENIAAMEVPWDLERAIGAREGYRREHEYYTDACLAATKWTTKAEYDKALDDYYKARGFDVTTGIPTRTQLEKLGMKDVADDLEKKYGVKVPA